VKMGALTKFPALIIFIHRHHGSIHCWRQSITD